MQKDDTQPLYPCPLTRAHDWRVMLCSPDEDLTTEIRRSLATRYQLDRVHNAAEALASIARDPPDLLLCDDAPPALDAMALLHTLRDVGQPVRSMPIMVLSNFDSTSDIAAGRLAGADEFLTKPVHIDLLDAAIVSHLRLVERVRAATAPEPARAPDAIAAAGWRAFVDRLSFGIIMSDRGGQPLFANTAARVLAANRHEQLRSWARSHHPSADTVFASGAADQDTVNFHFLPVASAPGAPLLLAHLDLRRQNAVGASFVTLLFSADSPNDSARLMAKALGLTATETLVANHLANGTRLKDIAKSMSVTMPTVNYHLRNIYQKGGISRQSDAVRLLCSVPLAPPDAGPLPSRRV